MGHMTVMDPSAPPTADPMIVFDRSAVRRHRTRAAPHADRFDFLRREAAAQLGERLADIGRSFKAVLQLGVGADRPGQPPDLTVVADPAAAMLAATAGPRVAVDEDRLPFRDASFDLVVAGLTLHWVNDLPGALIQIRRCLKPDGLFLAAMLGGRTLAELRQVLLEAEAEVEGGAGPRVSPFADVRDLGGLLQRAGFAMPVADADTVTVDYVDALALMRDLRGMGETNAVRDRRRTFTRRATLLRAAGLYHERFADAAGRIPATFQLMYMAGWAPGPHQPKPLKPGSAATRLADALGTREMPLPDKAGPR